MVDSLKSNWLSTTFDRDESWSKDAFVLVPFDESVNGITVGSDCRALENTLVVF